MRSMECGDYVNSCSDAVPERASRFREVSEREQSLVRAIVVLVFLMNIPYGRYLLYPFMIFSTWVHEMCHGMAAVIVGGGVSEIYVYGDGSGLCYSRVSDGPLLPYHLKRAFVASAGYMGTALIGGVLLLFRRTRRGPRRGLAVYSFVILLSCALWIRNQFGIVALILIGIALGLCSWKLPAERVGELYAFLSATCCLNAVDSIWGLFNERDTYVGGEESNTDAETVAEYLFPPYWLWAVIWFVFALVMLFMGLIFAPNPSEGPPSAPYEEENSTAKERISYPVHIV